MNIANERKYFCQLTCHNSVTRWVGTPIKLFLNCDGDTVELHTEKQTLGSQKSHRQLSSKPPFKPWSIQSTALAPTPQSGLDPHEAS